MAKLAAITEDGECRMYDSGRRCRCRQPTRFGWCGVLTIGLLGSRCVRFWCG